MNFRPIFAGVGVAAGGSALICGLKLSELTNTVWGCAPPYEVFAPWGRGVVVSLITCLLALIMATRPERLEE